MFCGLVGAFFGSIAGEAGLLTAAAGIAGADRTNISVDLLGASSAWLVCWALLAAAKRAEDVFYGFSDDERADRAAAPLLLGLPTMAAAAAFGWACSRCFLPVQ